MTTSSNNPPPRVVAARSELETCLDALSGIRNILTRILERPDPQPIQRDEGGWPRLGWESHDDPEQNR